MQQTEGDTLRAYRVPWSWHLATGLSHLCATAVKSMR